VTRTAALSVRIEPQFKQMLEERAKEERRTLAAYIERVLELHHAQPAWTLRDPQPVHGEKRGPRVLLRAAEGWPSAMLLPEEAEALGRQLIHAAGVARGMPPAE
jgi:hypothetical protein